MYNKKNNSYLSFINSPYRALKNNIYFNSYDHLFDKFRNSKITFVEIGVLHGGSLFMWRDFFGSKARIIGIDLNPTAKKWEEYGFEIFIGDQKNINFWKSFNEEVGKIDILLDDGGHRYEQQIITVESVIDNINDGGLIVIEDTHTSYFNEFGNRNYSFINYIINRINKMNTLHPKLSNTLNLKDRIWSIEILPSIVALKIDNNLSKIKFQDVENKGLVDEAYDFRNSHLNDKKIQNFISFFKFLNFIPFLRSLAYFIKSLIFKLKLRMSNKELRKYFR